MAGFPRTHGDAQPVFALDVRDGNIAPSAPTAGVPFQPQGPKLDFYTVTANVAIDTQQGVNQYVSNVVQAIQQTTTVAIYQVDSPQISFAIYPTASFANAATFLAAANVTTNPGFQLDSATNLGFKLSTT